jgi:hypothetical protein
MALEPNAEGNVMVDIIMGPYRSQRLTMTAADGQAAIDGHWATAPNQAYDPDHEPHDPLTDQERQDALTAATTWAQTTWDAAQGVTPPDPPPPEGGVVSTRAMKPDGGAGYKTREAKT